MFVLDSTPGDLPTPPGSVLEILLQRISVGSGETSQSQSDGDTSPNDKKFNDIRGRYFYLILIEIYLFTDICYILSF